MLLVTSKRFFFPPLISPSGNKPPPPFISPPSPYELVQAPGLISSSLWCGSVRRTVPYSFALRVRLTEVMSWILKFTDIVVYLIIKTSYGILRILNFDWLRGNGIWFHIPLTINMLGVRVFFAIIVVDFEVYIYLWVFVINQLFHSRLLDMR